MDELRLLWLWLIILFQPCFVFSDGLKTLLGGYCSTRSCKDPQRQILHEIQVRSNLHLVCMCVGQRDTEAGDGSGQERSRVVKQGRWCMRAWEACTILSRLMASSACINPVARWRSVSQISGSISALTACECMCRAHPINVCSTLEPSMLICLVASKVVSKFRCAFNIFDHLNPVQVHPIIHIDVPMSWTFNAWAQLAFALASLRLSCLMFWTSQDHVQSIRINNYDMWLMFIAIFMYIELVPSCPNWS